jgi:hypothetical protein
MGNHGYLPHNGVGAIQGFITGTQAAFGMGKLPSTWPQDESPTGISGPDLATFLAIYGAIFDGDLTSYSIGGPLPTLLNLGGLLVHLRDSPGCTTNMKAMFPRLTGIRISSKSKAVASVYLSHSTTY